MTVEELIKKLGEFDGDMVVIISDGDFDYHIDVVNDDGVDKVVILEGTVVD